MADSEFIAWSKSLRKLCRPRWFYQGKVPYVREKPPGEIKGKKNVRRAKRERVKALKALQV